MPRTLTGALAAAVALLTLGAVPAAAAAPDPGRDPVPISGAGSTWSGNAIDNWRRNIQQQGIFVDYDQTGSTDGRRQFANATVDFGVSEIPYGMPDMFAGTDTRPPRTFGYIPIVAGGTAFMYNLRIGGQRVTNLRLSGEVIAKIFTGVIKRWNDPAVRADNPGLVLPARTIVPVVRQEGSGTSAQFTLWMSKRYPQIWGDYCVKQGKPRACGATSLYPNRTGSGFIGRNGSTGVAGYVSQANAEGAITYVEYSYAKNARFPVVKVLNAAGYYVEPTASNVAVALTRADIDYTPGPNYLTQKLDRVYVFDDSRTYPLSSYSYMIIPQRVERNITEDKGFTIATFANYFLCEGQQQAEVMGYSPLPVNLVERAMIEVRNIPSAPSERITIASCNNPTFSRDGTNTLARTAKRPSECDKQGRYQSGAGTAGALAETRVAPAARCVNGRPAPANNGNAAGGPTAPGGAANPTAGPGPAGPTGPAVVDPDTGEVIADGGAAGDGEPVVAVPVSLDGAGGWRTNHTIMVLAAVLVIGLVIGPPLFAHALRDRTDREDQS